jgi:hypothetical protein
MKRLLFVLLVFAGGCGAGYAFAHFDPPKLAYRFEYRPAQRGDQLRCSSPAYAALFETLDKETIDAHAGKGTDTAAIKIDRDAKNVTFLTGAGVRYLGTMYLTSIPSSLQYAPAGKRRVRFQAVRCAA